MESLDREVYEFPVSIPLKVIGRNEDNFEELVMDLFKIHVAEADIHDVYARLSRGDTYLSMTVTFMAQSREHLDLVYRELSSSKRVMMVL
jgi:putative lipoic acid-binding regulatory protein